MRFSSLFPSFLFPSFLLPSFLFSFLPLLCLLSTMKKKLSAVLLALAASMPMTAQNLVKGNYGYLYCHMSDKGEWTAYAISRDGYNYQDINGGNPIFNPEEHARIKGGTRDAYITCMHNGKGYIMVTTDMCVRKSHKWTTMVSIS